MKIIVALGNPGSQYQNTRHNVGWVLIDRFAADREVSFVTKSKFIAEIAEYSVHGEKTLLVKPTTYYNLIGQSIRSICDFYKVEPADVLLVHDDLALPLGTVRTRIGGSSAGNNGVKSISEHLGENTSRLRVGTWTEHRETIDDADFVLSAFTPDEQTAIRELTPKINEAIDSFIAGSFMTTTHR